MPLIFKTHLEVLSFQVPTWRNIKAVRFSEVLSSSHLEIRLLYHIRIWTPKKITRRFQKWIPLCLPDPNDATSQSVQVLLLGSVTAAPQPELGDCGGLDPQPLEPTSCNHGQSTAAMHKQGNNLRFIIFLWLLFHANSYKVVSALLSLLLLNLC